MDSFLVNSPTEVRADEIARTSYGRLLAILASSSRDIESAEDSLADAFSQALSTWPVSGIPQNPEAWLITVARNRQRDITRSAADRLTVPIADVSGSNVVAALDDIDPDAIPDRRLALLFVCAHPAIDSAVRTPLMLQTVLGFDAEQIARAFVLPTATLAQRLVRAKRRIRDAGIRFVIPDRSQMPARLTPVLEAIYGAYAIDWHIVADIEMRDTLAAEAHWLAVALAELLPEEPEVLGLAAVISFSLARRPARGSENIFVPLDEQDVLRWDTTLIAEAEALLRRARQCNRIGRFQIEAAIQSVHCARAATGITDWTAVCTFYAALMTIAPTLGARVAHAAAVGRTHGARAGLDALDMISGEQAQRFQPAWAVRAQLLHEAGMDEDARRAYEKAISLTTQIGERRYLELRRKELGL